jgi:uroporphyrin-III C-methyltransferase
VTLAKANESESNISSNARESKAQPLQNLSADTLVYYMGRKDAANIAKQLIENNSQHTNETPAHVLEAVSTKNERHWSSTLGELANGKANNWFDSASPALIMVGEALREHQHTTEQTRELEGCSTKIDDGLQDSSIFPDSRRSA